MTPATSPPSAPRAAGALLLLGSATPRPESVTALRRSRLPQQGRRTPAAGGAGARHARRRHGRFTRTTAQALAEVRSARGKAIVLLNRRGWSNFLSCRSCGRVWSCPDCDVALVLHRADGYVACHHCGHRERRPRAARTAPRPRWRGTAPAPSASHTSSRACSTTATSRSSASTRTRGRAAGDGAGSSCCGAVRGRRLGRPDRDPDGRQGPRLPAM